MICDDDNITCEYSISFIVPHFEYGSSMWLSAAESHLKLLDHILIWTLGIAEKVEFFQSYTGLYQIIHIPSISFYLMFINLPELLEVLLALSFMEHDIN